MRILGYRLETCAFPHICVHFTLESLNDKKMVVHPFIDLFINSFRKPLLRVGYDTI